MSDKTFNENLDEILEETWESGFDSNGDFPTEHRGKYKCIEDAKQAILSLIESDVIGEDEHHRTEVDMRSSMKGGSIPRVVEETLSDKDRNSLRAEQRAIVRGKK